MRPAVAEVVLWAEALAQSWAHPPVKYPLIRQFDSVLPILVIGIGEPPDLATQTRPG